MDTAAGRSHVPDVSHAGRHRGHRQLEHTADLAIELWAPDEGTLLVEGAQAVVDVLTDGADVTGEATRSVELESVDAEDRLVRWVNEVLWLAVGEGFLVADADVSLTEGGLTAIVRGVRDGGDRIRTELKSATYHDLHLEKGDDGLYRARIVIDV